MPDGATLAVFSATALALLVVAGPAVLYIVAQSVDGGRRAGRCSISAAAAAVSGSHKP